MLGGIVNHYKIFEQGFKYRKWSAAGKSLPPPHFVKEMAVRQYARRFNLRTLVETGTYRGVMVNAIKRLFDHIYSIELDPTLHRDAVVKFKRWPHIKLLQGDSATMLAQVLREINEPCLFWLDAHYSGGVTARAGMDTPIVEELKSILAHPQSRHVILIDDARCFDGENDYPSFAAIVRLLGPDEAVWDARDIDDIIRLHRRGFVP